MTESGGVPTGIPGVQIGDTDQEILRFDSIIRDGPVPPHSPYNDGGLPNGRYVLVIRSERSWYGPHRVIFKGDSRFYGRTTNGKYELDVTDLRNAFVFANTATEKISSFQVRTDYRVGKWTALSPLAEGPKLVIHCMALESFGAKPHMTSWPLMEFNRCMQRA